VQTGRPPISAISNSQVPTSFTEELSCNYRSVMTSGGAPSQFERARHLYARRRFHAAKEACAVAMRDEPTNSRAMALNARIDASLGTITFAEARIVYLGLAAQHPDDTYFKAGAAAVLAQGGDRPGAIEELCRLAVENEHDPLVHQSLAVLLVSDPATQGDAWSHYKVALATEPLRQASQKVIAYKIGKRIEPAMAEEALNGTGVVDKVAIRTLAMGKICLQLIFYLVIPGFFFCLAGSVGLSFGFFAAAATWAAWCAYAFFVVGNRRGTLLLSGTIPFIGLFAIVGGLVHAGHRWTGYAAAVVVLATGIVLHAAALARWRGAVKTTAQSALPDGGGSGVARPSGILPLATVIAILLSLLAVVHTNAKSRGLTYPEVIQGNGIFTTISGPRSASPNVALGSLASRMQSDFGESDVATQVFEGSSGPYTNPIPICPCYGPPLSNAEEASTFLFETASVEAGRIVAYFENFPTGTPYRAALRRVLEYLPHDVRLGRLKIDRGGQTCGLLTMTSRTLAREVASTTIIDPKGEIGVQFGYTNANSVVKFDPKNVESDFVTMAPLSTDVSCLSAGAGGLYVPQQRG
jgi:hypothetical protein